MAGEQIAKDFLGKGNEFVIGKISEFERRKAVLEGGEGFARTAGFKVVVGDFLAIRILGEKFKARESFIVGRVGKEVAKTRLPSPADAAAKLMKLGQTKAVGRLNNHNIGIGNIDADFDDGSGDQNISFIFKKFLDNLVAVFGLTVD